MVAAFNNNAWLVENLALGLYPLNKRKLRGSTALMIAARQGSYESVVSLVNHGAKLNLKDFHCRTALAHAKLGGHTEIATFLEKSGAK